jgi:hypothetical protein
MHIFVFGFIFHIWEKTCDLCLSEPSLFHLTWCFANWNFDGNCAESAENEIQRENPEISR